MEVNRVGVTAANLTEHINDICNALATTPLIGLDIETDDPRRHPGLAAYNGKNKALVFDINRTDLCGLSLYPDGGNTAWYFNVGHADIENRISWSVLKTILEVKPKSAKWVIHNANFERTMLRQTVGWDIEDYICTLLMAVSAYSPDEYDLNLFMHRDLGAMQNLVPSILAASRTQQETQEVLELLSKITAKESDAGHSYNGYVKEMAYGYGLKQAVERWFGYRMRTFEETLNGRSGMSQLTTEEVAFYGCDDAIWCLKLYHKLMEFMLRTNPQVIQTYFMQELPMVETYSESWRTGVRIDAQAVITKEDELRITYAEITKKLKKSIQALLPFPYAPHPVLMEYEKWYQKNWLKYRSALEYWAKSPDSSNPFEQATQLSGALPNAWAEEEKVALPKDRLNITHYMPMRVLMYDLFRREKPIIIEGKIQSDAWARGRLQEVVQGPAKDILTAIGQMATIEQASKLYLTPYKALLDPDTDRLYPVMGSELATRRTSMKTPNAQQLAKRGESVYIRGFYLADYEDHVIVSIDLSQIELVLIGEFSGDPYFAQCYGQLPYDDLHLIAVADQLDVDLEKFKSLKYEEKFLDTYGQSDPLLLNSKGEYMDPRKAYKWWRTELGKGTNFSYWYSGALSQVGQRLGWTSEQMWEHTEKYRNKFSVGERWRINQIQFAEDHGYVVLPDGHRRTRFEATPYWADAFRNKWRRWNDPGVQWFADLVIRRIQTRAKNQAINAIIQGSCATIAKRSEQAIRKEKWSERDARFMFLVHDELVYSVQRNLVPEFIQMASKHLTNHPDIISNLKMDCSPSVGLTFEPWSEKTPLGQIELREAPEIDVVPEKFYGQEIPTELWGEVVNYLFRMKSRV